MLLDFLGAMLLLPAFCLCVYVVERVLNRFVEKKRREEKMRLIKKRRRELALYLALENCA